MNMIIWSLDSFDDGSNNTNSNNYNQYIKTTVNIDYGINNDLFSNHTFIAVIIFRN